MITAIQRIAVIDGLGWEEKGLHNPAYHGQQMGIARLLIGLAQAAQQPAMAGQLLLVKFSLGQDGPQIAPGVEPGAKRLKDFLKIAGRFSRCV